MEFIIILLGITVVLASYEYGKEKGYNELIEALQNEIPKSTPTSND